VVLQVGGSTRTPLVSRLALARSGPQRAYGVSSAEALHRLSVRIRSQEPTRRHAARSGWRPASCWAFPV
jgi:hypothetical protein